MNATYNITDNRIKFWPPVERLTAEQDKVRHAASFVWWPGRKCFAATWSPQAEDFVLSFGVTIDEDDTPDDLEGRVERFAGYAERDEADAESAAGRALDATTARRLAQAEHTASKKLAEAEYWQRRIAGAIRHAAYLDKPDVIARRIKGLEATLRGHRKTQQEARGWLALWNDTVRELTAERAIKIANYSHGQVTLADGKTTSAWAGLTDGKITPEDARSQCVVGLQAQIDHHERWAAHLEMRLNYERTYLDAVGGDPVAKLGGLKPGDLVIWRGEHCEVLKVNKVTVEVQTPQHKALGRVTGYKVDKTALTLCEDEVTE